ncbi:disulfide bond formation protein DsbA [Aggregicoccus sp. 17bor-14]|uniref:DsbA family protein n=1 Tax=Myxococcaceae TaxID=31 RepID=UPI00129C27A0|nr:MULTISPECIES: thioredoxin domain-containing protein [Myxococcaceae]MBF5041991.1 thioredoxin domain-containing protein [Simulacricoccus sp. 17bor-14]MRI87771.1 disulfide bond formation protein DsbA [Aggregicoccus sp. 17bor-14]
MNARTVAMSPEDHVSGSPSAPVMLLEYGDYQCPFCGRAQAEVERLRQALGSRLCLVFRHFPLTQAHPYAEQAAEAAEAAGAEGRFWEMHQLLYENQDDLSLEALIEYAGMLDLDVDAFASSVQEHRFHDKIRRDFMTGVRSGVNGTPTFFINGHRHDGAFSAEALLEAISGSPLSAP